MSAPVSERPIDCEADLIATLLRDATERARQRGYDAGYADALSLTREGTAQQLVEQRGVGEGAQRVA